MTGPPPDPDDGAPIRGLVALTLAEAIAGLALIILWRIFHG